MKEKLFFPNSKQQKICGILSNPTDDKEKPIIILMHGFSSSKESSTYPRLEEMLNTKKISTFRFDFNGHGESEGNFEDLTVSNGVDDALSAIKFLKEQGYQKIGLLGTSFGGMVALITASRTDDLFLLILKCPVCNYFGKIIAKHTKNDIDDWKEKGFITYQKPDKELRLNYSFYEDAENMNGYEAAKKINIPTFIIHGREDKAVPVEQSQKTCENIDDCKLEIVEKTGHDFSKNDNQEIYENMLKSIFDFIVEKMQ